jgi:tetratricopeptide (TPR) repeat protein
LCRELNELQKSAEDYTLAMSIYPDIAIAHIGRAHTLRKGGDMKHALADYARAIDIDQANPEPYFFMSKLYEAAGDNSKAEDAARMCKELGGDDMAFDAFA